MSNNSFIIKYRPLYRQILTTKLEREEEEEKEKRRRKPRTNHKRRKYHKRCHDIVTGKSFHHDRNRRVMTEMT